MGGMPSWIRVRTMASIPPTSRRSGGCRSSVQRATRRRFSGVKRRQEVQEIPGVGGLPEENRHAPPQLLQGLLRGGAFVVGAGPPGDVGVQGLAPNARGMAIHQPAGEGLELRHHPRVFEDDSREVHDLGQPQDPRVGEEVQ